MTETDLLIDFFGVAGDAYEFERFSRRRRIRLFGQSAWIAAPEEQITNCINRIATVPNHLLKTIFNLTGQQRGSGATSHRVSGCPPGRTAGIPQPDTSQPKARS